MQLQTQLPWVITQQQTSHLLVCKHRNTITFSVVCLSFHFGNGVLPLVHKHSTARTVGHDKVGLVGLHRLEFLLGIGNTIAAVFLHQILTEAEAAAVASFGIIDHFTAPRFNPAKTVGVIVPYRRQIALIRQALADIPVLKADQEAITIDTVERYQGSQRDVIIYSFAITHRYQLDFLTATTFTDDDGTLIDRKLNVALTRARRQMIIIGRPDLLERNKLFRQLKCNPN